ncbi:RTA1-domain-containing protein [Gonapodya prolifera JEL478]|uniref:RTA1-domain-containing protein n=1 Tax=Gonapodya prolifera (strain JEL478) TaxID=1344416 RepID=A0A139AQE8_GONPJ|nr:RTA1-domain-containing protein [Gonapodya prolifera JEL478]|eukprot:KXS18969.1 RTA1-domain-containing protein [Gonapodya prolifera JEL478]
MSSAALVPWEKTLFHYEPSVPLAIAFIILFAITGAIQAVQTWKWKTHFMWTIAIGCLLESVGFAVRIKAKSIAQTEPRNNTMYSAQFTFIVIAPIFFAAGVYILLSRIVGLLGEHFSPINHRRIAQIFVGGDISAFTVQIIGSLMILIPKGNQAMLDAGLKVLIAGLAIQVVTIFVYILVALVVFSRARNIKGRWHLLMWCNILCSVLILFRNVFRVAEFWGGFDSRIATTEALVYALDAGLMFVLAVVFIIAHPAYMLKKDDAPEETKETAELDPKA